MATANSEGDVRPPCPHAAAVRVDYPNTTLTIRVAMRCLGGEPAWIRVDDLATYSNAPQGPNDYSDNPFNATGESEATPRLVEPAR